MRFVRLRRFCSWRYPAFGDESHGFWSVMTVHRSCILGDFRRLAVAVEHMRNVGFLSSICSVMSFGS